MQSSKSLAFARLLHFEYAQQRLLPKVNRVQRTVPVPTMQALLPANCSICRGSSSSVSAKKKKHEQSSCLSFCGAVYAKQMVLSHLVLCTDTACLFVCYVRCARFLQMLCACISLCLRSTETCSEQSERNSGTGEYYSPKWSVYAKQSVLRTLPSVQRYRVLIVCYVRCARCPQMLCACVSLCLRSVGRSPSCA